ncbi:hypothetical protein Efla_004204 [Eimeria flavescens]
MAYSPPETRVPAASPPTVKPTPAAFEPASLPRASAGNVAPVAPPPAPLPTLAMQPLAAASPPVCTYRSWRDIAAGAGTAHCCFSVDASIGSKTAGGRLGISLGFLRSSGVDPLQLPGFSLPMLNLQLPKTRQLKATPYSPRCVPSASRLICTVVARHIELQEDAVCDRDCKLPIKSHMQSRQQTRQRFNALPGRLEAERRSRLRSVQRIYWRLSPPDGRKKEEDGRGGRQLVTCVVLAVSAWKGLTRRNDAGLRPVVNSFESAKQTHRMHCPQNAKSTGPV